MGSAGGVPEPSSEVDLLLPLAVYAPARRGSSIRPSSPGTLGPSEGRPLVTLSSATFMTDDRPGEEDDEEICDDDDPDVDGDGGDPSAPISASSSAPEVATEVGIVATGTSAATSNMP